MSSHLAEYKHRLKVPRHIAIIMDGNGRWAKAHGLPRIEGHREGVKSTREIVEGCGELGVEYLTLYTFSTENWKRSDSEVSALMNLLFVTIGREIDRLMKNNVKLRVIGRLQDLLDKPRLAMEKAIHRTKDNTGLVLSLALSYGGRTEILEAAKNLARSGRTEFDEVEFSNNLYTAGMPDPDLLIRTSGEMRISNFLLWQLAYAEIVVTDTLWPEFRKMNLVSAIDEYGRRERRFGARLEANS